MIAAKTLDYVKTEIITIIDSKSSLYNIFLRGPSFSYNLKYYIDKGHKFKLWVRQAIKNYIPKLRYRMELAIAL